jgi:hypothetical protein
VGAGPGHAAGRLQGSPVVPTPALSVGTSHGIPDVEGAAVCGPRNEFARKRSVRAGMGRLARRSSTIL